ncbi:MAG TPA: c-type cytochrome [Vicinamibacteria bacterium]
MSMRDAERRTLAGLCASSLLLVAVLAVRAQESAPRTTRDGVYTAEQAERGKEVYQRACAECHALDWYRSEAVRAWNGAPVYNLFDLILSRMPPTNPGSLKTREYVDILAYVFALNEQPVGPQELPTRPEALKDIRIQWRSEP